MLAPISIPLLSGTVFLFYFIFQVGKIGGKRWPETHTCTKVCSFCCTARKNYWIWVILFVVFLDRRSMYGYTMLCCKHARCLNYYSTQHTPMSHSSMRERRRRLLCPSRVDKQGTVKGRLLEIVICRVSQRVTERSRGHVILRMLR